ncbi:MAG: cyclopropane-fatty-acyl-phospholipid synthase family protein [Thioalkalispiraceae bacterium]|jgi:cyclopropane-fatty-acyl-phospholipid synthase
MNSASQLAFDLTEQGLVPDAVMRRGIRFLVKQRLKEIHAGDAEKMDELRNEFIKHMQDSPVALVPEKANEQHYEVPAEFYLKSLGPKLKYSCAYWPSYVTNLADAEVAGLEETCKHADIQDGQEILELGCGWGSLTLWMAALYPNSQITAVSNSHSQREHIERHAKQQNLNNLTVITCDMNEFNIDENRFDRIVSVEMFEHMRNWPELYKRVASWLKPGGYFFKHIFVHRTATYAFEDNGPSDWMSRHFFTGGMMPSDDLALSFQNDLKFVRRWRWDGTHYEKTANAWLERMDQHESELLPLFSNVYGEANTKKWWSRWRLFFMACAELFGYENGQQWWVSHYLFEKPVK